MNYIYRSGVSDGLLRGLRTLGLVVALSMSMSAEAGLFGFGGTSWKEEVLLHDGSKIIVARKVDRGGRHEIGQEPPIKEQSLSFTMPGMGDQVTWKDDFSEDVGSANFLPMLLDVKQSIAYLVVYPMGCLSYNKWGRPNPPYVIFKYQDKDWKRIPLQELPSEIKQPNLIFSSPDEEAEKIGKSFIPAETIQNVIANYPQPEFKSILRDSTATGMATCPELAYYKGGWISTK